MIVHRADGWHVRSEKGKNLGGPYKTQAEAKKRLAQVEFFKHRKASGPPKKKTSSRAKTSARKTTSPRKKGRAT
jgi:hypothetical protein